VDRARYPGRLMAGQSEHRKHGMDGLTVIAGVDPAAAGYTAIQVWGLDRQTGTRWVLEVVNKRAMPPHELRSEIQRITERYGVSEWRIEKNAYQASIVQDHLIRTTSTAAVCWSPGTHTDSKKWDSDYGVASIAVLFDGWQEGRNLIRLPSQTQSEPVRNFIEQLCAWFPETKGLTDTVMAAWFVEIRCRELMQNEFDGWHTGTVSSCHRGTARTRWSWTSRRPSSRASHPPGTAASAAGADSTEGDAGVIFDMLWPEGE
jgi:hypothetical protein